MACLVLYSRRTEYESWFERFTVEPIFGHASSLTRIQEEKESYNMSDDTLLLLDTFGEDTWVGILESPRALDSEAGSLTQVLWQMREAVSFEVFERFFHLNSMLAKRCPVLQAVLDNERTLELVKCIGDILAWHKFLFAHVSSDTTREQVNSCFFVFC